jgi:hypothetical protein
MTTRTAPLILASLSVALCLSVVGCKDDKPTTNPGEVTTGDTAEPEPEPEQAGLPPQDPDPAEIAALYDRYLKGEYEEVASEAETLRAGLTADTQVRAHALASSIGALAAVEGLPEDGRDAATQAIADAERLDDPEVEQIARIAHGTYLVRVQDSEAGRAEIASAITLAGPYGALAQLMLGEALLNQAFGVGDEDMKIKDPGKLDEARTAYQSALDSGTDLLKAHAHEGLAAVAKYKGEKDTVCSHAQEAENLYAAAGASSYVREVPMLLAGDSKCKDFKQAK